jgi:hypothetical protein
VGGFTGTQRPPVRWCHARTDLEHFALISYRVDPDRLGAQLPPGAEPEVFTFDDGTSAALVSAVPFVDRDFHFRFCPPVTVSCGQVNYRAYIRYRGERGVWFFGTSLDSPFVALPRLAWRMPWHRDRVRVEGWRPTEGPSRLRLDAAGDWGSASAELVDEGRALARLDGFADLDETLEVLTHPMVGWYRRTGDGATGRYSVWHEVLDVRPFAVRHAHFAVFERLGLVAPDDAPHSALVQRRVGFDVHTPPTRA